LLRRKLRQVDIQAFKLRCSIGVDDPELGKGQDRLKWKTECLRGARICVAEGERARAIFGVEIVQHDFVREIVRRRERRGTAEIPVILVQQVDILRNHMLVAILLLVLAAEANQQFVLDDRDVDHAFDRLAAVIAEGHLAIAFEIVLRMLRLEQDRAGVVAEAEQRPLRSV
jgi:hypothetical protein